MNFSPLYHEYNPSNSGDERCVALACRWVGGIVVADVLLGSVGGICGFVRKNLVIFNGKNGKNGYKTARQTAQGHEVINVLLKSSA